MGTECLFGNKLSSIKALDATRNGSTAQPHPRAPACIPFLSALKFLPRANRRRLSDERNLTRIKQGMRAEHADALGPCSDPWKSQWGQGPLNNNRIDWNARVNVIPGSAETRNVWAEITRNDYSWERGMSEHVPEWVEPFHQLLDHYLKPGMNPSPDSGGVASAEWKGAHFAKKVGCSSKTVQNWRYGHRVPERPQFEES